MNLLISNLMLLGSSMALAEPIEGEVIVVDGVEYLSPVAAPNQRWKIKGTSDQLDSQLSGLQQGDYLSAAGDFSLTDRSVYIDAVDFVGLKRILGHWQSQEGFKIFFKDFRTAVVEQKQELPWNPNEERKVDLVYAILPKASNWSLFMSNRRSVRVGTLSIQENLLTIQLVDQKTGQITEDISLSPLIVVP